MLVLASTEYEPADYMRDYDPFVAPLPPAPIDAQKLVAEAALSGLAPAESP